MNYFVDFKELKFKKEYNPRIYSMAIDLTGKRSLVEIDAFLDKEMDAMLKYVEEDIPSLFVFQINGEDEPDAEDVVTYAHLIVPMVLRKLETGKGYKRERRLDAPEKLKALNIKTSTIKRAVNYDIKVHCLNIKIECGDFIYYLCDGSDIKELDHE